MVSPAFASGEMHRVLLRRLVPRPVVLEVVRVEAVQHHLQPQLLPLRLAEVVQLRLAEVAAVRRVGRVLGVGQLVARRPPRAAPPASPPAPAPPAPPPARPTPRAPSAPPPAPPAPPPRSSARRWSPRRPRTPPAPSRARATPLASPPAWVGRNHTGPGCARGSAWGHLYKRRTPGLPTQRGPPAWRSVHGPPLGEGSGGRLAGLALGSRRLLGRRLGHPGRPGRRTRLGALAGTRAREAFAAGLAAACAGFADDTRVAWSSSAGCAFIFLPVMIFSSSRVT